MRPQITARRVLNALLSRVKGFSISISPTTKQPGKSNIVSSYIPSAHPTREDPEPLVRHAHINILPYELLTQVFLLALPEDDITVIRPFTRYPQLTLSHVCSRWRHLIFSMESLWKQFTMKDEEGSKVLGKRMLDRVMGRSRARAASLSGLTQFWFDRASSSAPTIILLGSASLPAMPVVMKNLGRCDSLALALALGEGSTKDLLSLFSGDTSSLIFLSVTTRGHSRTIYKDIMDTPAFFSSPHWQNLRVLKWLCESLPFPLLDIPMPQLGVLQVSSTITLNKDLKLFLSRSPNLTRITFEDLQLSATTNSSVTPFVIPNLHTFHIHCMTGNDPLDALASFTLPSLTCLALSSEATSLSRNYEALEAMVTRSSCHLEIFTACDSSFPPTDFAGYLTLPCMKPVRKLHLTAPCIQDRTIELLRPIPSTIKGRILLPNLKVLDLGKCSTTDGLLADVVASRRVLDAHAEVLYGGCDPPARLEELHVAFKLQDIRQSMHMPHVAVERLSHIRDIMGFNSLFEGGLAISFSFRL
ncbi:hypothetical protein Hypma_001779 [Hypsizygus marmoreus]|uniref:F-box domain-containing protein n=1 Tax=Hypsizygus marmoreus TaxID=39966 RepID=A0A369J7B6_HYPMA|nr:hypothetical protein Hypma_001779 [Hypsizygus marmoreus]